MNKFIKLGISLITGVALFFALSSNDKDSPAYNKNAGNKSSNKNSQRTVQGGDVIIEGPSENTKSGIDETSSGLRKAQGVFNTIANAINTVLTMLGNFSKLTTTNPNIDYVIYT